MQTDLEGGEVGVRSLWTKNKLKNLDKRYKFST